MRTKGLRDMGHHFWLLTLSGEPSSALLALCREWGGHPSPRTGFSVYLGEGDGWPSCQNFSVRELPVNVGVQGTQLDLPVFHGPLIKPRALPKRAALLKDQGLTLEGHRIDFWFFFCPPWIFPSIFGLKSMSSICDEKNTLYLQSA